MTIRRGGVATKHATKYMTQLCKHWSHKFETEIEGDRASVTLPAGTVAFASEPDRLRIEIEADTEAGADRLMDVVASHLDRFAFREAPLDYEW